MLRAKVVTLFSKSHVLHGIQELANTLTSSDNISENIVNEDLKFNHKVHQDFDSNGF